MKELWLLRCEGLRIPPDPTPATDHAETTPSKALLMSRIRNTKFEIRDMVPMLVLAVALIVYGSMHLLAWNYAFSSPAEKLIWQMASVVTAAFTPVLVIVIGFVAVVQSEWMRKVRMSGAKEPKSDFVKFSSSILLGDFSKRSAKGCRS